MQQKSTQTAPPRWAQFLIRMVGIALVMALGAGFGYLAANWFPRPESADRSPLTLVGLVLIIVLASFLAILFHEAGHVIGGRLAGSRFLFLIAGPLRIQRIGERIEFGLNRSLALSGGIAASIPAQHGDLRRSMLLMVAGGPIASVLTALAAAALLPFVGGILGFGLLFVAVINAAIALATLFPIRSGGFNSDGARLLMLLRGGPLVERWCAASLATSILFSGRPRDIPAELIDQAINLPDGTLDDIGARMVAYNAALDQGAIDTAGEHLEYVLAHIAAYPPPFQPSLRLEAAYFNARYRDQAQAARSFLAAASGGVMIEPYTRKRVEAAVLLAEGHAAAAHTLAAAGLAALEKANLGAAALFEQDMLHDLLARSAETTDNTNHGDHTRS